MAKMTKGKTLFLIVFFGAAGFLFIWQRVHWPVAIVVLKGEELNVQVARTIYHQYKGMGGRESWGQYEGMLFPFGLLDKQAIVMRDMEMPIDIVWLRDGVVVDIAPNVQPEPGATESELRRYLPRVEANLVLELPAGWTQAYELKIGDKLEVVE